MLIAAIKDGDMKTTAFFEEVDQTAVGAFNKDSIINHLTKARDQLASGGVKNAITGWLTLDVNKVAFFAELISDTGVVITSDTVTYEK